jgi:hypothetical protein
MLDMINIAHKQDEMKWDVNWMLELNKICKFIRVHQGLRKFNAFYKCDEF